MFGCIARASVLPFCKSLRHYIKAPASPALEHQQDVKDVITRMADSTMAALMSLSSEIYIARA